MRPLPGDITLEPAFQGTLSNSKRSANGYQNEISCNVSDLHFKQSILQQVWELALSLKSQLKHLYHLIRLALPLTASKDIWHLPENQIHSEARIRKAEGTNLRWIKTGRQHQSCTYPAVSHLKIRRQHLAGQSVLCVGGRAVLYSDYRQLIEAAGGRFMVFRGSAQTTSNCLSTLLACADNVICPADCINHEDFFTVKHYCQCTGRNCILLERSDLITFSKAVKALTQGNYLHPESGLLNQSAA